MGPIGTRFCRLRWEARKGGSAAPACRCALGKLPASRPTSRPAGRQRKQNWTRKGPDAPRRRRERPMEQHEIETLRDKVPCAAVLEREGWMVDVRESTARAVLSLTSTIQPSRSSTAAQGTLSRSVSISCCSMGRSRRRRGASGPFLVQFCFLCLPAGLEVGREAGSLPRAHRHAGAAEPPLRASQRKRQNLVPIGPMGVRPRAGKDRVARNPALTGRAPGMCGRPGQ